MSLRLKCAIYLRVSSKEQTVENQLPQLLELAKSRGYDVVEVYQENESAWRSGHQRELWRFMNDLKSGRVKADICLVWALDRLSREGPAAILNLVNSFKRYGVKVISYHESWTEVPGEIGEILYAITGWVARMESQRRSERTKAGLARVVAEGKLLGRPAGAKDRKKRKRTGYLLRYASSDLREKYAK